MSSAKKYQRWVNKVIEALINLGLEVTDDRKNKYRVVKGFIEGKPYQQRFSNTPKSYVTAARNVLAEAKRKLLDCGINVEKINAEMPMLFFLTADMIAQANKEEKYKPLAELLRGIDHFDEKK